MSIIEQIHGLQNLRLALALGITPEQVATVNRLERDHERAYENEPYRLQHEFEVEIKGGTVRVGYVDSECGWWSCEVMPDGKVKYDKF